MNTEETMGFILKELTVFVAIDSDGDEGVIGLPLPGSSALTMPAVCGDEARVKDIYPIVTSFCKHMGVEFRAIQLSTRRDVTEKVEKKYGA